MPKSILVVENNKQEWEFFRDIFELRGDKAVWIQDPTKAEDAFLSGDFDMIIIEALLPKISGYELCKTFKNYDKGQQTTIILTGALLSSIKFAHQARTKFMADDIIVQPYQIDDIEKKLGLHLDGVVPTKNQSDFVSKLTDKDQTDYPIDFSKARMAIPFSGQFDSIPFPRIIAYFSLLGENGTLTLEGGKITKSIFFSEGKPVAVLGLVRNERLGQILLKKGKIDEATFETAVNSAIKTGKRIGEVLLEMEAISPHELYQTIVEQTEEKILEIFSWETGNYHFTPHTPEAIDELGMDINIPTLILKGISEHWGADAIEAEFKDFHKMALYPVTGGFEFAQSKWNSPKMKRILGKINGKRTLSQIIAASNIDPFEAMQILFTLMVIEAVVLAPPKEPIKEDPPRIYKELGPRLILDNSVEGISYKKRVKDLFFSIMDKSPKEIMGIENEDESPEKIKELYTEKLEALEKDEKLYSKADELTRSRVDLIKEQFALALDDALQQIKGEKKTERKTGFSAFFPPSVSLLESEKEFRKGLSAFEMDDFKTAKDHFKKASGLDTNAAEYLAHLGYAIYITAESVEQKHEGMEQLIKAIQINPNLDQSYLFLGNIYRDKGEKDKAEENYQKAYENNPKSTEALKELRKSYLDKKLMQASVKKPKPPKMMEFEHQINTLYKDMKGMNFFDLLEATEDTDHDELQKKYFDLTAKYQPTDIIKQFDEVIQERAKEVFQRLTDAYSTLISSDTRADYLETLKTAEIVDQHLETPKDEIEEALAYFTLARQAMQKKEYKNASLHFRRAFQVDPFQVKYQAYMAYAIYKAFQGSEDSHEAALIKAKEVIRYSLAKFPDCDACYLLLGQIYFEENKNLLADEQVENALRINPDNIEALKLFFNLYSKPLKKPRAKYLNEKSTKIEFIIDEARKTHLKLKHQNFFKRLGIPKDTDSEQISEQINVAFEQKIAPYKNQLTHPKLPSDLRSVIYDIIGLFEEAHITLSDKKSHDKYIRDQSKKAFEDKFNVEDMTDHRKIFKTAKIMLNEGMFNRSIKAFEKAISLSPAYSRYQIWHGFAIFKANPDDQTKRDIAKEIIDKALDYDETNADAYWMMGKIFQFEGNDAQAVALYKKALEINPSHKEAGLAISLKTQREKQRQEIKSKTLIDSIKGWFKKK